MIISLNWLKKFTDVDVTVDELTTLIGARLVEIEEVVDLGAKYTSALIVKVIETGALEGSDHLSVTKIDDGGVAADIERDENGYVQVVCGAPNIKTGQTVVWLPPKSTVPETFGKAEPFVLDSRKLRGVISNGMIASSKELDLSDDHDGILEIVGDYKPGTTFAEAFELNDYLLDIENKSLTHRPDCFGIVGFAREVAAIQGKTFKTPNWLDRHQIDFSSQTGQSELNVAIDNPELSSRYLAVVMSEADGNTKSPFQIQTYLSRVGVRPINAVVDVTNYLMMLTGQPLHAFDYDKLVALNSGKAEIHVRAGRDKEKLELLDGRTIELTSGDIVIASGETAIGLAGAMGGASTAIDDNTKNIIIESASFNLYNLRATQMRHGIFSEAITRFTKGQPAELSAPVLSAAIHLMEDWAGAKVISHVAEAYPVKAEEPVIEFESSGINDILGSTFTDKQIIQTLQNVEFTAESNGSEIKVTAPYWRADIHIVEDLAEEVGRLNGFDNINPVLPVRNFVAVRPDDFDTFRTGVRKSLVRAGANEVLTYSFVHGNMIDRAGQVSDNSYRIVNSISPDLQYYRQSLTPNLLDLVHPNIKQGYDSFALFEINKTHPKADGLTDEKVPVETDSIALVIANKNKSTGAPYYQAKKLLDYLAESIDLDLKYEPFTADDSSSVAKPFEYRRSAKIIDRKSGAVIGIVGEYKKSVAKGFKLPEYAAGFEVNARMLFDSMNRGGNYTPLSRYPSSERDVCFKVDDEITYSQIMDALDAATKDVKPETTITPVDIYKADGITTKNVTVRIKLTAFDHTLTSDEVATIVNLLITSVISKTQAIVI